MAKTSKTSKTPFFRNLTGSDKARIREDLKARGQFSQFSKLREKYKVVEGLDAQQAWKKALQDFPEVAASFTLGAPVTAKDAKGIVGEGIHAVKTNIWKGKPLPTRLEVVNWIFANLPVRGLKPEDAPDGGSWQLLQDVQASAVMRKAFFDMWGRVHDEAMDKEDKSADIEERNLSITINLVKDAAQRAREQVADAGDNESPL